MDRDRTVRPLLPWALALIVSQAPLVVLGSGSRARAFAALAGVALVAAAALVLHARTTLLQRVADAVAPRARLLLGVAVAAYVGAATLWALKRWAAFENYDQLGLFAQSYWTTLHGHPFANTTETVDGSLGSHLGVHFTPSLLLLLPLYALVRHPLVLLVAQAAALALAVVPAFALLRRHADDGIAALLALLLLALPNVLWLGFADFHDASFAPLALLTALWALETRRPFALGLAALLALGLREEAALVLVVFAFLALVGERRAGVALALVALALGWIALSTRVLAPRFASPGLWMDPQRFFALVFSHWGATPGAVLTSLVTRPLEVVRYVADRSGVRFVYDLLAPLLVFPPFADGIALAALPGVAMSLLSSLPWARGAMSYYNLVPAVFLALAAYRTAARAAARGEVAHRGSLGVALVLVLAAGLAPALLRTVPRETVLAPPPAAARAVVARIPADARLYAPMSLFPHLCHRVRFDCWASVRERARDAGFRAAYDWVVVWPDGDRSQGVRDAALVPLLDADPRFVAVPGCEPFRVWRRR